MSRAIEKKRKEWEKEKAKGDNTEEEFKPAATESDILHRLYKLDQKFVEAFGIMVRIKSPKAFSFFERQYRGFEYDK
jgi:hypothetical protein